MQVFRSWRLLLLASLLPTAAASQQPSQDHAAGAAWQAEAEEVPLRLRHLPWVDIMIVAMYVDGRFYLPAGEILQRLHISHEVSPEGSRVSGHYLREETPFRIDFAAATARVGEREFALAPEEFLAGELEYFVLPGVFERIFDWRVEVHTSGLELRVASRDALPVARAGATGRRAGFDVAVDEITAAVRLARDARWAAGGVVDYMAGVERTGAGTAATLQLSAGAEVFGGELEGRLRAATNPDDHRLRWQDDEVRWRYVLGDKPFLSQVTLGKIFSSGVRSRALHGIELTNRPIEFRARFGTHAIQGQTEPEWEVEVYVHNRLAAVTRADPLGRYRVEVPLGYGTALIRLRYLGPGGEVREEEQRVEVPFAFLPPGRADYTLAAGWIDGSDEKAVHAEVAAGVTEWLSARAGADWVASDTAARRPVLYQALSARIGDTRTLSLELAQGALGRLTADWAFAAQGRLSASFTQYAGDRALESGYPRWEASTQGYLPASLAGRPVTLRFAAARSISDPAEQLTRGDAEAIASIGPWAPSVGYRAHVTSRPGAPDSAAGEIRASSLLFLGGMPWPLRNGVLRVRYAQDLSDAGRAQWEVGLSARLTQRQRLDFVYSREPGVGHGQLAMRLQLERPFARATTTVRGRAGAAEWTQTIGGAIGLDAGRGRVDVTDRSWVGKGGILIHSFLDENANGIRDPGEQPVPGVRVSFDRTAVITSERAGEVRATELLAYHRYQARVDTRAVPNPLWTPRFASFSLVAEPNRVRTIDVPFYVAGTVEGEVTRRVGEEDQPIAGLKVHLRNEDGSFEATLRTFADGYFYHPGLPPGRYTARIDSGQMEILGAVALPEQHAFEIRPTREGDYVEGVRFQLLPRP